MESEYLQISKSWWELTSVDPRFVSELELVLAQAVLSRCQTSEHLLVGFIYLGRFRGILSEIFAVSYCLVFLPISFKNNYNVAIKAGFYTKDSSKNLMRSVLIKA